ncbi:MAG: ABC transporter permease [Acidimicrobiaceae bacterium]|nr:ABC transporter permease [Acidimicrobiaceae bacterium]
MRTAGTESTSGASGAVDAGEERGLPTADADRGPGGRLPSTVTLVGFVALALLALPVAGLLQRAPWSALPSILSGSEVLQALRVSLTVSLAATAVCAALGLPLALVLARLRLRFPRLIRALVMLPMVLPPVVGGTALLFALGRRGLAGQWLDSWFGISLPFTTAGAVTAAAFVALPFFVVTVETALRQAGTELDEAAATLGAGAWARILHVTLPTLRPALLAGVALAWARALGEFGATLTFAGSFAGRTRTLPLETYLALERDPEAAVAVSLVLIAVALAVLVTLRDRWTPR